MPVDRAAQRRRAAELRASMGISAPDSHAQPPVSAAGVSGGLWGKNRRVAVLACACYDDHSGLLGVTLGEQTAVEHRGDMVKYSSGTLVRLDGWYRVPCLAVELVASTKPLPKKERGQTRKESTTVEA